MTLEELNKLRGKAKPSPKPTTQVGSILPSAEEGYGPSVVLVEHLGYCQYMRVTDHGTLVPLEDEGWI